MQSSDDKAILKHATNASEHSVFTVGCVVDDVGFTRDRETPVLVDKLDAEDTILVTRVFPEEGVGRLE